MGSLIPPWAFCERNLSGFLSLPQKTPGFEGFEDSPHRGRRNGETLFSEEDGKLSFPQEGEFLPESLNSLRKLRGPLGLPDLFGSSGPILPGFGGFFGVPLFLPPKGGFGLFNLSQVTATGWTLSTAEDFKDSPFLESPWT
jgi:hypothetical protein